MSRQEIPVLIFVMLVGGGCASRPVAGSGSPGGDRVVAVDETSGASVRVHNDAEGTAVTLAAPADLVYPAVTSTYAFLKVPLTYSDKSVGAQGNTKFIMSRSFAGQPVSAWLNCGDDPFGGPNANNNPVTVSIVTRVRASGGTGTVLETVFSGSTYKQSGNTGQIFCASTGALEQRIAKMVASRITDADKPRD